MKKLLLILLCLPILALAQKTYVPDDNFEAYLEVMGLGDGIMLNDSVLTGNINTVTTLNVDNQNISDLTGIEDFTALQYLHCYYNQLTSLDVSQNTVLATLNCSWNNLTSLDVSQNTALTWLNCELNQLTSLDLSNNTALTYLDCGESQLTSIDLRNHTLQNLNINTTYNQNLFCIDVDNPTLAQLLLTNIDSWTSFDTNCVTALGCTDTLAYNYDSTATINDGSCYYGKTYVPDDNFEAYLEANGMGDGIILNDSVLTGNINTVTSLNVNSQNIADLTGIEAFTALTVLFCINNQLTSLDLRNHTLQNLSIYTTNNPNLFCIDVDNPTLAQSLLTSIDSWTSFDTNCVTALGCADTLAYNYDSTATINDGSCYYGKTYVPDDNFENYLEAYGMGDGIMLNDSVSTVNINTITSLTVDYQNISDLTGIEDFTALNLLRCFGNQLTSLDVSQNTVLTTLRCGWYAAGGNPLQYLDISSNTSLIYLDCSNNQITSLDVSQNTALTTFYCRYNQLTSLDVSQNTALTLLSCGGNLLTSLDVSNNLALNHLNCQSNQLTSLDVSNNTSLTELECYDNQLTSIDVSNNTALTDLECYGNQLTSLDLRNHTLQNLSIYTTNNPNLFCIDVDNPTLAQSLLTSIDPWTSFDTNCVTALGCMDSLACNYDNTTTIADNSCTYIPVTLNNSQVTCSNFSDATLTVNYNTGSYTYLWNNGETTQSIDSLPMGSYSVIVTDSVGCSTTLNANVNPSLPPVINMFPEICYITVDSATGNNKVIIKPMANPLTSKFIIYKEFSANIYNPIDTMNINVMEYLDISSNPMAQSYRYKVSVLDTCGNESTKSSFHKTIHLTMSLGINGEINLLWNAYEGYQPTDYLIFRSINNGSMNQIATLSGTNLAYTDLTPPTGNLNYQVRAIAPNCNIIPFAKNSTSMLVSNVINHSTTAVNELVNSKKVIKITDLLGRETKLTNQPLFYIYDDGTVEKRIVIE